MSDAEHRFPSRIGPHCGADFTRDGPAERVVKALVGRRRVIEHHDQIDPSAGALVDTDLGIAWPIREPIVSAKDNRAPRPREIAARF